MWVANVFCSTISNMIALSVSLLTKQLNTAVLRQRQFTLSPLLPFPFSRAALVFQFTLDTLPSCNRRLPSSPLSHSADVNFPVPASYST